MLVRNDYKDKFVNNLYLSIMKLFLLRLDYQDKQTLGQYLIYDGLELKGSFKCLELPWRNNERSVSCIPEGDFTVVKRMTNERGLHFHILGTEPRTWILIHKGNYKHDIQGCQLPGMGFSDMNKDGYLDVYSSTIALNKMLEILPDEFEMTITS